MFAFTHSGSSSSHPRSPGRARRFRPAPASTIFWTALCLRKHRGRQQCTDFSQAVVRGGVFLACEDIFIPLMTVLRDVNSVPYRAVGESLPNYGISLLVEVLDESVRSFIGSRGVVAPAKTGLNPS